MNVSKNMTHQKQIQVIHNRTLGIVIESVKISYQQFIDCNHEMDRSEVDMKIEQLKKIVRELEKKHFSKDLARIDESQKKGYQEDFYLRILKACPSLKLEDNEDIDKKVVYGYRILGGISQSDFYLKEYDLIIEFDGPCHFF